VELVSENIGSRSGTPSRSRMRNGALKLSYQHHPHPSSLHPELCPRLTSRVSPSRFFLPPAGDLRVTRSQRITWVSRDFKVTSNVNKFTQKQKRK